MSAIEYAANQATSDGTLRPLQQGGNGAPVLATPAYAAYVGAATALYAAGNMITDLVGQESQPAMPDGRLGGKSSADLLDIRRTSLHG